MNKDPHEQLREVLKEMARKYEEDTKIIIEECNLTDLGNAKRLVIRFKDRLRYCHPWRKWLVWDGTRWKVDATAEVWRYAIKTVGYIYTEAERAEPEGTEDKKTRRKIGNHAVKSEAEAKIKAMISLANSQEGIPVLPDELDKDPLLLNISNGAVDLQRGQLLDHSKERLITKLAPVKFDTKAACPLWLDFLNRIMFGNNALIEYLQRVAGYCLTGKTGEHKIFLPYGGGGNGKSTFLKVLQNILGDYAVKVDSELLIRKPPGAHTTAVTDLKGTRLAITIEVQEGRRMAEALVKELTGGDSITARRMRQDNMTFEPTHKIIFATNHKPMIHETTHAFWRRIALIPFNYVFAEEERIKDYHETLLKERDGILQWMLKGCLKWQKQGLGEPKEVTDATKDYRTEMDILGDFLADCCVIGQENKVCNKELRKAYADWCQKNGEKEISSKVFSSKLQEKGFIRLENVRFASSRGRGWKGFHLTHIDTN